MWRCDMTRRFQAHFENGVIVPDEKVDFREKEKLTLEVTAVKSPAANETSGATPTNFDDPNDPRPEGGVELVEWWSRHQIPAPPGVADRIARSKYYEYNQEEPDDDAG